MTKYYNLEASKRWIIAAPDDMDIDTVFDKSIIDFSDTGIADISFLEEVPADEQQVYDDFGGVDLDLTNE